jgi:hypothetical protein
MSAPNREQAQHWNNRDEVAHWIDGETEHDQMLEPFAQKPQARDLRLRS